MNTNDTNSSNDDQVLFAKETDTDNSIDTNNYPKFKLLIVDDEKEVHSMTRLVLADYKFKGRRLKFLSAYSGEEAKQLIHDNPDAACILLDVVMETKHAGLEVARFIREDEKNDKLRIILRTGQPGKAPEKDIILDYDINDYKEKTELTTQKLFTTVTTALRSYLHLVELDKKTQVIALKNTRLNEEIARRIVAESNLTKYNRSLEKMIDSKSHRLKDALLALEELEVKLKQANQLATIGEISSNSLDTFDSSGTSLKENLDIMDSHRADITFLLEKYLTLQKIITSHPVSHDDFQSQSDKIVNDIDQYKDDIDFNTILEKYPEIIKDSNRGIDQIARAVDDIKLFISINDENSKKSDINTILKSVTKELKPLSPEKSGFQTDFGEIPKITICENNIKHAFYEIIKNACQALKPNGIVSISTLFQEPELTIIIGDIGEGIEPDKLEKIFDPYFTKDKPDAKGLGLSFAKCVILSNNGTIEVDSNHKEGTTVTIKFMVVS